MNASYEMDFKDSTLLYEMKDRSQLIFASPKSILRFLLITEMGYSDMDKEGPYPVRLAHGDMLRQCKSIKKLPSSDDDIHIVSGIVCYQPIKP